MMNEYINVLHIDRPRGLLLILLSLRRWQVVRFSWLVPPALVRRRWR
jgi:hypothetical protein